MHNATLSHKKHSLVDHLLSTVKIEGISYASIGVIKEDVIYSAFSHDTWRQYYIDHNLHAHDPTFQAAIEVPELPIFWDCVTLYTKEQIDVMRKRREVVGARGGVTFCFKRNNKKLLLTLGTPTEKEMIGTVTKALSILNVPEALCSQLSSI